MPQALSELTLLSQELEQGCSYSIGEVKFTKDHNNTWGAFGFNGSDIVDSQGFPTFEAAYRATLYTREELEFGSKTVH